LATLLESDRFDTEANFSLGVLKLNNKAYAEAAHHLQLVLDRDATNIDARTQLANAYFKNEQHVKAEEGFRRVLSLAPTNVDALIGLGEVLKDLGDAAEKAGNSAESEDHYSRAIRHFEQVLSLSRSEDASKKLNTAELSEVHYSLGYTRVKLSEAQKHRDSGLLNGAQKCFDSVSFGTPNYYKAQRAKQRIEQHTASVARAASNQGARVVVILAIMVFLFGQVAFYLGKPVFGRSFYSVDVAALASLLAEHKLDAEFAQRAAETEYFSVPHGVEKLQVLTNGMIKGDLLKSALKGNGSMQFKALEPIDATTYGFLTFGGILFVMAGLYLREVSKLKFGAIEMEKTARETVAVSTSLGITK
jgi:tetratricopeptide (TPR) repeat protein